MSERPQDISMAAGAATVAAGQQPRASVTDQMFRFFDRVNFLVVPLVLFLIALSILSEHFLTTQNIFNIMRAAAVYLIIGVGQTFVMTSANIDLSVGSALALVMALTGTFMVVGGGPVFLAVPLALLLGAIFGFFNGLVVTRLHIPALLATLGTMVTYRGVVHEYMGHRYYTRLPESVVYLGQGMVGPVPVPVIIAVAVALIGWLLYRYTRFGRYAVAIGGNEEAAILAGINVRRWKTLIFTFQGLLVGLAALIMMGRLNAAHPTVGQGMELHVIAGVVLGGTLLFGGYGTILGTVLGMILIGVLENGLLLARLGFFWQQIVLGLLIIFAVAVQIARQRRLARS